MKTLATCKPTEFITQTLKIKELAEVWLKDTGIMDIRRRLPELKKIESGMTLEERKAVLEGNKNLLREQSNKNLSDILNAVLKKEPIKSLQLLALCCFVEPENVDDNPMEYYLDAIAELVGNTSVVNFFISLVQLGQITTLGASKELTED